MKIKFTNKLNGKEIENIENLLNKVNKFDNTYRDPYLDSDYNFNKDMPSFFMAYNNSNNLIGILTIYADSKDVEIQIKIDPDYRRQKVATHLYETFLKETKEYNLNTITFLTEEVFLNNNPDLMKNLNLRESGLEEFQLSRKYNRVESAGSESAKESENQAKDLDLIFEKASSKDLDELTKLTQEAFNIPLEVAKKYTMVSIESDTGDIYFLKNKKEIISRVSVDFAADKNYMYSVATKKEYLRQGYAHNLLARTIKEVGKENKKDFQISVNAKNTKAKNLYEKLGFVVDTKVLYLHAIDE